MYLEGSLKRFKAKRRLSPKSSLGFSLLKTKMKKKLIAILSKHKN